MEGTLVDRVTRRFGVGMFVVFILVAGIAYAPFDARKAFLEAIDVSATRGVQSAVLLAVSVVMVAALAWLMRRGTPAPASLAPYALGLAWLCAVASAGIAPMNREHYFDVGDNFHYYVGAKYARELAYDKHYECVATALEERGRTLPKRARDLRDNKVRRLKPVLDAGAREACRALFTPERWASFGDDVEKFRNWHRKFTQVERRFKDHGYNGTPVWTVLSGTITNAWPLSEGYQTALGLLNLAMVAGALTFVVHAFGWELGLLYALLFWTQYADRYLLVGALLRYLPLSVLLCACALLKLERPRAAGACFGLASALLIFPSLFAIAAGLYLAIELIRARGDLRSLPASARQAFDVVWSSAATFIALVLVAVAYHGGTDIFGAFLDKMAVNSGRLATGRIGLLFNFLWLGDAASAARWVAGAALLAALALAYRRANVLTFVVVLGFALFFVAFPTVRYYYMGWVAFPLALHAAPNSAGSRGVLIALFTITALCYVLDPHASHAFIHNTLITMGITAILVALAVPRVAASVAPPPTSA